MSLFDKSKEINWLYKEIPDWIEKGLIPSESAEKLQNHYGEPSKESSYNLVFILTGVLGAILIGGGIIAVFASNWENLTRPMRTVLSFAPLVVAMGFYAFTFFKKQDSIAWVESTAAFLMLMIASSLALISQTYHIEGSMAEFLFQWLILCIPLLFLTNSTLVTMLYLAAIAWWAGESPHETPAWKYWALLAAAIPHLWSNIRPHFPSIRGNLLGWTAVISIMAGSVLSYKSHEEHMFLGMAGLIAVFYLLGKLYYPKGESMWSRPFQTTAIAVLYGMTIFMAFATDKIEWKDIATVNISWIFIAVAAGLQVYLITKEKTVNYFVSVFPLVMIAWILFSNDEGNVVSIFLANLYLLAFGIFYVWKGVKIPSMSLVNAGMFFISSLILTRFLQGDDFLIKGIAFILIGMGFLGVNIYLNRKLKREATA